MGGSSSKSDMAAPVIVRETEKHLATVGAFHSFFSHFILRSYCTAVTPGVVSGLPGAKVRRGTNTHMIHHRCKHFL